MNNKNKASKSNQISKTKTLEDHQNIEVETGDQKEIPVIQTLQV